jgi:Tfp pilus assembly protein PilE
MRTRKAYKGITLVEIMVATLLVVLIVSMVYASYSAAARSSGVYTHRLSCTHQAHLALQQTASLIQGCYVPHQVLDSNSTSVNRSDNLEQKPPNNGAVFRVGPHVPDAGLMQLISTKALVDGVHEEAGLFETILRFDRSTRTLLVGQRSWPNPSQQWIWQSLLTQVESLQITVFDGQRWYPVWDLRKNRGLPRAVTLHVTVTDEHGVRYGFERTMSLTIQTREKPPIQKKNKDNGLFLHETLDI